jgi:hypothetical protein
MVFASLVKHPTRVQIVAPPSLVFFLSNSSRPNG